MAKRNTASRRPEGGDAGAGGIRINRYLRLCGVASRRAAEELVRQGRVSVNERTVTDLAARVHDGSDVVRVDGSQVIMVPTKVYLVMNKPKDTITTMRDERNRQTVKRFLREHENVFPVGRLDRHTTGVLLFTNDGEFAHRLMHPRFRIPKSYLVTLSVRLTAEHLRVLRQGVRLNDGMTAPADVELVPGSRGSVVGITIREGRNRQVRRMFEHLGYMVEKLDRVAYGPVTKEGIPRGQTRRLSAREVRALKSLAGLEP